MIRSLVKTMKNRIITIQAMIATSAFICFFAQVSGQDVHVITHHFYFDTDVSNQVRADVALNFTDQDDGWMSGRIMHLKVVGFADCEGEDAYNQILSEMRARFIADNIVKLGVVDQDFPIEVLGGGELPCISEKSKGDSYNRRVDVIITYEVIKEPIPETWTEKIEEDGRVELVGVNFQPGRHVFLPESSEPLRLLLETLKGNGDLKIELQGHICCQPFPGDGQDNDTGLSNLSEARAKAVYDYLIQNGIEPARLKYKGMGNYFPKVQPEMTEADRIANRRVEAVVWE
jgi:outer membrane protein OmpA-like peptidoglycan-associated protein